jgi:hypothetical protein
VSVPNLAENERSDMRKIFIATAVCIYITGSSILGYCQDDSAIEQSESQVGQSLDSEISSERAPNTAEAGEANEEFEAGEKMSL